MEKFKNALVIDADARFRQFVTLRLEILGYRVREAETPAQIEQAFQEGTQDLIVSEFAIPGLEGLQLILALEPSKRPVFLLTDWISENPQAFLDQTRVRAVIPKKKKSEFFKQLESLGSTNFIPAGAGQAQEKHILLIEDSATIRHRVRRILEKEMPGCVIREAEDGREAISEMAQKKVDLIITDLQMPGMDGQTFLRKIRNNGLLKQKPILVFSSSNTTELQDEFKNDTCLEFLSKPASSATIVDAIHRLWDCQEKVLGRIKR